VYNLYIIFSVAPYKSFAKTLRVSYVKWIAQYFWCKYYVENIFLFLGKNLENTIQSSSWDSYIGYKKETERDNKITSVGRYREV